MKKVQLPFKGFIDTTFRDGQQSPLMFDSRKYRLEIADKKVLLNALIAIGIRHFEFFSPNVNNSEANDFLDLKNYIKNLNQKNTLLLAHVRCHREDIANAIKAGFDGLNIYMGLSEKAQKHSHGLTTADILRLVTETISTVRSQYPNLYLRFSAEDCFRTPLVDIFQMYDAIYPFINTFGMPDTVGIASPAHVAERVTKLKKRYPMADIECHFHNDRGLALINALTAIESGATYVDTSIWGLAERSGITSITGILLNLYHEHPEIVKKYHLEYAYPLNVLMGSILNLHVPYNEPVSLTNRTHIAGVHQKAILNDHSLYEAHDLGRFGVTQNQLLLGPLSGWNLIYYYLREIENLDINPDQAKELTKIFKNRVEKMNKQTNPKEILLEVAQAFHLQKFPVKEQFLEKRLEILQS